MSKEMIHLSTFAPKVLLILSSLFPYNYLCGQIEFSPAGAEWCYQLLPLETEEPGYLHLTYRKDTTLGEQTYKIIEGEGFRFNLDNSRSDYSLEFWFFQRNDSIFYYGGTGLLEDFLFKLNYEVGEITSTILFNANFKVLKKESIQFETTTATKFSLALALNNRIPVDIYDRFGPNRGFVDGWWTDIISGDNYELFQYKDFETATINFAEGKSCFGFFNKEEPSLEEPEITSISCPIVLYPNPASNEIFIQFSEDVLEKENLRIWVRDNLGRTTQLSYDLLSDGLQLDVASLASGIYHLHITGFCENFISSFIKIEE